MKILQYIYGLNIGGAETYIYNIMSKLDDNHHFDFVLQSKENENVKLLNLCKNKKSKIFIIKPFYKAFISHMFQLNKIIKNNDYKVIHIHMNSMMNIIPIFIGKMNGLDVIIHSHSTKNNKGVKLLRWLHLFNRTFVTSFIKTINVACGVEAGKWMFNNKKFIIMDNAAIIEQFVYNEEYKSKLGKIYNLDNFKVIGHIGRYVEAKNHFFLIDIFNQYVKTHNDVRLVLIGDGEKREQVINYINELGIEDKIIVLDNQNNINEFYSLFDCFLFPSKFEGFPFVLIEAQISGIPIITSDKVTKSVDLFNEIEFLSLDDGLSMWINKIELILNNKVDRNRNYLEICNSKYNVDNSIQKLIRIYEGEKYEDLYYNM